MTQTIAQQIKWNFEANGDLIIKEKNGNHIYLEYSNGWWAKSEYDSQGNTTHYQNSNGFWAKQEWDSQGNRIYFEDSDGYIIDKRPKSCEGKIVEIGGEKFKLVKV